MSLSRYDYEKLLDDIKLISRAYKFVLDEKDENTRKEASTLVEDLITRLYRDIKEMKDSVPIDDREYGGYLFEDVKEEIQQSGEE